MAERVWPKNQCAVGTFFDNAFQLSLRDPTQDPLPLQFFDVLGYLCIPHCGIYGEGYEPFTSLALIELPIENLQETLPASLFRDLELETANEVRFFISILKQPTRGPCQHFTCESFSEMNLMFHAWCFPDAPFEPSTVVNEVVMMGVFDTHGIAPAHQNVVETAAGMSFDRFSAKDVCMHYQCFSPCNAQVSLQDDVDFHHFFAAAKHENRRVITFFVMPANERTDSELENAISSSPDLATLVSQLSSIQGSASFLPVLRRIFSNIVPSAY
eukprot:TRINITY_DN12826_c0_g1_i1.p1 TRINITY_DN12826_c0_g1~~TRINITY_DN12826_c0_g1_i1.p1  ORF type:complete len:271 (+),score=17.51 TRINITY_DN12826_c0_g1_i1:58-870(+)